MKHLNHISFSYFASPLLILMALLLAPLSMAANNVYTLRVHLVGGADASFVVDNDLTMRVVADALEFAGSDGSRQFLISDVELLQYAETDAGIESVEVDRLAIELHGNTIAITAPGDATCDIYRLDGTLIAGYSFNTSIEISLDDLRAGVYLISVNGLKNIKFIKQ